MDKIDNKDEVIQLKAELAKLRKENERLENRFGLVWKDVPEKFIKYVSDEEVLYGESLYRLILDDVKASGKTLKVEINGQSHNLVRQSDSYLFKSKETDEVFLLHSNKLYQFEEETYEQYVPILEDKGGDFFIGDNDKNVLIEGDNYYALQMLQYTHRGKVDVIYIDPPYNTGNKDFKYNDRFIDDENGDKHSSWYSFMERRLSIAKHLLNESGLIYISIDDNELFSIKLICDKIFGEHNFVSNFIRRTAHGPKSSKPRIDKHHEYLLCYSKDKNEVNIYGEEKLFSTYSNPDNDPKGEWTRDSILIKIDDGRTGVNARYPITNPYLGITHYPPIEQRKQWHYTLPKFEKMLEEGKVVFYKDEDEYSGEYSFYLKKYKTDIKEKYDNVKSLFATENIYSNSSGTKDLKELFSDKVFTAPKPISLIKKICEFHHNKRITVLDFFAGSGTTGHAVWDLNKEDGGNRKFILVTNNENNICEDVTFERLKRANSEEHGGYNESLKYLKVKHMDSTDIGLETALGTFEALKNLINLKFGSFQVECDDEKFFSNGKVAVLKKFTCLKSFMNKYSETEYLAVLCNDDNTFEKFKQEAWKTHPEEKIIKLSSDYMTEMKDILIGEER